MTIPDKFSAKDIKETMDAPVNPAFEWSRTARVVMRTAIIMTTMSRTKFNHCWIMTKR